MPLPAVRRAAGHAAGEAPAGPHPHDHTQDPLVAVATRPEETPMDWYRRLRDRASRRLAETPTVRESWEAAWARARQPRRLQATEEQLRAQIAWALLDGNEDKDLAWAERNAIEVLQVLRRNAPLRIVK